MARNKTIIGNRAIVAALKTLGTDNEISRFHKMQLIEIGALEAVKAPELKEVLGSRGRMPYRYQPTKWGRSLLALSKGWTKKAEELASA